MPLNRPKINPNRSYYFYIKCVLLIFQILALISSSSKAPRAVKHTNRCALRWEYDVTNFQNKLPHESRVMPKTVSELTLFVKIWQPPRVLLFVQNINPWGIYSKLDPFKGLYMWGNRFPGCGGTAWPCEAIRSLFLTVRTPRQAWLGENGCALRSNWVFGY